MTEQQLITLTAHDILRVVMHNRSFHLITRHAQLCSLSQAGPAPLGHVRCWCLTDARWITIVPDHIFAYQTVNSVTAPAPDSVPDPVGV